MAPPPAIPPAAPVSGKQVGGRRARGSAALVAGLPVFPLAGLDVGNRKGVHGGALRVFASPVIEAGCVGAGVAHEIGGDGEIVPAGKQLLLKIVARRWPGQQNRRPGLPGRLDAAASASASVTGGRTGKGTIAPPF